MTMPTEQYPDADVRERLEPLLAQVADARLALGRGKGDGSTPIQALDDLYSEAERVAGAWEANAGSVEQALWRTPTREQSDAARAFLRFALNARDGHAMVRHFSATGQQPVVTRSGRAVSPMAVSLILTTALNTSDDLTVADRYAAAVAVRELLAKELKVAAKDGGTVNLAKRFLQTSGRGFYTGEQSQFGTTVEGSVPKADARPLGLPEPPAGVGKAFSLA